MGPVAIQNESKHYGLLVSVRVNASSWGPLAFKLKGREMIQRCSHQGMALLRVVLWGYWEHAKDYPPLSPAWHTSPIDAVLLE